jgi:hypothetical protein
VLLVVLEVAAEGNASDRENTREVFYGEIF